MAEDVIGSAGGPEYEAPSMKGRDAQGELFELPPQKLAVAPSAETHRELAARLPPGIRLGTMSWSYPGWKNVVYAGEGSTKELSERGLTAYVEHPLLGAVEIDRSYYDPLPAEAYRRYAEQVPDDFRFLVKAHEDAVVRRFPLHARYGKKRGASNARYLDASYVTEALVGPLFEGLGGKLGALLFQFPPELEFVEPEAFAERLERFLSGLPRVARYAVEVRNPELLTSEYAAALVAAGGLHCHNLWTTMPPLAVQAKLIPPVARSPLIVRWLLRHGDPYGEASERFKPFDRLAGPDPQNRERVADLVARADAHGVPALVLVDNKAEGCAPLSIVELTRAIVEKRATFSA
jgi:uncharacterized protein YecE (DUF72 family)